MDSTSTCNTIPPEKDTYRKYNKQPILFKPSPYQKPSNTFCWKSNRERALFDITSTWNSPSNLTKVSWEDVLRFDFAVESYFTYYHTKAVVWRCSVKKVLLEISQNTQENTCARVFLLIKLQAPPATLLKKRLWHRCFPVYFAKFLRAPFFTEHLWRLLLTTIDSKLRYFTQYSVPSFKIFFILQT